MISQNATLGLSVETLTPAPHSNEIDVHENIRVRMNSELIPNSIVGNFRLMEDLNWSYDPKYPTSSLENKVIVKGKISYQDRCITFTPEEPLKPNTRYIIYLKENGIMSITSGYLMTCFSSVFYTRGSATLPPAQWKSPTHGTVVPTFPRLEWESLNATVYLLQISRHERFDTLIEECRIHSESSETPATPVYETDKTYDEGVYYTRVRGINGHWSDVLSFMIQHSNQHLTNQEDASEYEHYEDYEAQMGYDVHYVYPPRESIQQSIKTGVIYAVFSGRVEADIVDWNQTYVWAESFEEGEELQESDRYPQGIWKLVYQRDEDQTYLVFLLGESEEEAR